MLQAAISSSKPRCKHLVVGKILFIQMFRCCWSYYQIAQGFSKVSFCASLHKSGTVCIIAKAWVQIVQHCIEAGTIWQVRSNQDTESRKPTGHCHKESSSSSTTQRAYLSKLIRERTNKAIKINKQVNKYILCTTGKQTNK